MAAPSSPSRHPVDEVPPLPQLVVLGLQHVLALYAGAVAVPLVVGGAMVEAGTMHPSDIPHLIVADLFVAGIASMLQAVGVWRLGARLPLMQGVTFASVSPMISIGTTHGLAVMYGSVIACGVFMLVMAPFFARLVRFFPPLVTGTIITLIGLSLMTVCAGWISGTSGKTDAPGFGDPANIGLAIATLVVILVIYRWAPSRWRAAAVLIGVLAGTALAAATGHVHAGKLGDAQWFAVPQPFLFGAPTFEFSAILTMCIVGLVVMTETAGDLIAVGEIVGRPVTRRALGDGLRADGFGSVLGGVFGAFPYSAFAQNVGLVAMTKVRSRHVATAAGVILIVVGLVPKSGEIVASIPQPVLGGAGLVLFGQITASGIRTLSRVEFTDTRALIVGVSISLGMLPSVLPTLYREFPDWFHTMFHSGISTGAVVVVLLTALMDRESMRDHRLADDPAVSAAPSERTPGSPVSRAAPHHAYGKPRIQKAPCIKKAQKCRFLWTLHQIRDKVSLTS